MKPKNIMYIVTQFLLLNKSKVERRLILEIDISEDERASERQLPSQANSLEHASLTGFKY
jgi:hypothetical protein